VTTFLRLTVARSGIHQRSAPCWRRRDEGEARFEATLSPISRFTRPLAGRGVRTRHPRAPYMKTPVYLRGSSTPAAW
jgi:hypothetical protein